MKVLFLNPPFLPRYSRQSRSPCVTKSNTLYYPYYLAYAAGWTEKHGFNVKLADAVANEWSRTETVEFVKREKPELTVMDTSTPSIVNDVQVAEAIKKEVPETKIMLAGTFPTNMSEYTLNMSKAVDSVAVGEYDNTALFLARALEDHKPLEEVPGIAFKREDKLVKGPPAKLLENLDELPWASQIYLKHFGRKGIEKYFYASTTWPEMMILTARGCPWNCTFCNIPMKKSYRPRSTQNVIEEMQFIQSEMPWVNEIMFEDDTFAAVRKRTLELCDAFIQNRIQLKWSCNGRVTTENEVLQKMKAAGCRLVCVGFESATQEVLNNIEKMVPLRRQFEFMEDARKTGLKINGCFIFGLPGDTPETMKKTIEMAKELNPNSAQFYPLMVYPGNEAYRWAQRNGLLATEDYSKWVTPEGLHTTTVSRPGLPADEVVRWCNRARLEFYTNPKFLKKMAVQAAANPVEAVRMAKASKVLFKHLADYATRKDAVAKG
ncbi:MAG: radical SAM protein [Candidatus Diapherotrites archaeon]|nr:radical SAM protein [Candidatus Diapherotrites archaeon]